MATTVSSPGKFPQAEQKAADFVLPDTTGEERRLSELASAGPLVLLFYRGHW